jgi:pimeloyl-ACP methyl ester carboxylesterase
VERSFTIDVSGARLRALEVDDGGCPILVLHGGPGASLDYLRPQLDRLASGRCLLYYDQRGGGGSRLEPGAPPVTAEVLLDDLDQVCRALVTEGPVTLLGYSWGALLALLYALRAGTRVGRLALLSPAPPNAELQRKMELDLVARSRRPEVRALAEEAERVRESDPVRSRRLRFAAAVGAYFVDPQRALDLTPFLTVTRVQRSVWQSLGDYDLRTLLKGLRQPTLVIHGAQDPVPLEGAKTIAAAIPGAQLLVLPNAAHVPYIEDAEACFLALDAFLPSARGHRDR